MYSVWRCVRAISNASSTAARCVLTVWFQLQPSTGFILCEITNKHQACSSRTPAYVLRRSRVDHNSDFLPRSVGSSCVFFGPNGSVIQTPALRRRLLQGSGMLAFGPLTFPHPVILFWVGQRNFQARKLFGFSPSSSLLHDELA